MNTTMSNRSPNADVVDRQMAEFDIQRRHLGGEARLREVGVVAIDAEHAPGAAPLEFHRIEAGIAADIEHALVGEILRNGVREAAPLDRWVVAQEMIRRGRY